MTAALRKLPSQNTGATLPYDGLTWQNLADNEVEALWRCVPVWLTSIGGSANAITASSDPAVVSALAAYQRGMAWYLVPTANNTGSVTINIDAAGVKNLVDRDGNALVANTLIASRLHRVVYDGTSVRVAETIAPPFNSVIPDAIFEDIKGSGTHGGTANAGGAIQRTLNSVQRNVIAGCSLTANQFTLPAGTYWIEWQAPAFKVGAHQSVLKNVTDNTTPGGGTSECTDTGTNVTTHSMGFVSVILSSPKVFEIDHYVANTQPTNGLGFGTNLSFAETYTWVKIWISH